LTLKITSNKLDKNSTLQRTRLETTKKLRAQNGKSQEKIIIQSTTLLITLVTDNEREVVEE